jgi:hypothetical protein
MRFFKHENALQLLDKFIFNYFDFDDMQNMRLHTSSRLDSLQINNIFALIIRTFF